MRSLITKKTTVVHQDEVRLIVLEARGTAIAVALAAVISSKRDMHTRAAGEQGPWVAMAMDQEALAVTGHEKVSRAVTTIFHLS